MLDNNIQQLISNTYFKHFQEIVKIKMILLQFKIEINDII